MFRTALCFVSVVAAALLLSPAASADTPAWTDDPGFAGLCNEMRRDAGCAVCTCEAWTQTLPGPLKGTGVDLEAGVLVHLNGKATHGGTVNQLRVVLGNAKTFVDAGVVLAADANSTVATKLDYAKTAQFYDMCPGACEHQPVEAVHLFELTASKRVENSGGSVTVTTHKQLTACFKPPAKDAKPGCWSVPLSEKVEGFKTASDTKPGRTVGWERSWSTGGTSGMQLVLGTPKGHSAIPTAVQKAPTASYFHALPDRSDAAGSAPSPPAGASSPAIGTTTPKTIALRPLGASRHTVAVGDTLTFSYKSHPSVGFTGGCTTSRSSVVDITKRGTTYDVPDDKLPGQRISTIDDNGKVTTQVKRVRPTGGDKGRGLITLTAKAAGEATVTCRTVFRGTVKSETAHTITVE